MKSLTHILFIMLTLLFAGKLWGQKPERIYSFAQTWRTPEYYRAQVSAWKHEIDKDRKNAYAWYNYYRATRNLLRTDTTDTRSEELKSKEQHRIVDEMEKAVPASFEYNLARWLVEGNNLKYLPNLDKAAALGPDRPEIFSEMINRGELTGDMERRDAYARKWYSSGYSPGILFYNYNVLSGLKENAILITAGDNDTYAAWLLQAAKGVRKNVTVLNTSFLYMKEYRERMFRKLGATLPDSIQKDTSTWCPGIDKAILEALAHNTQKRPLYVGVTAYQEAYSFAEGNLYLTGLAYEYSKTPVDNMAILKKNFEQVYALDYTDHYFMNDISEDRVQQINLNYIVPMLKLYEHYKLAGEKDKAALLAQRIRAIAKHAPDESNIISYLETAQ